MIVIIPFYILIQTLPNNNGHKTGAQNHFLSTEFDDHSSLKTGKITNNCDGVQIIVQVSIL